MAVSLRKIDSTYAGSCIKVRNDSNALADIGFSGAGIDSAALLAHCGSGDGKVHTWYDQSGSGNNVTTTGTAQEPRIVNAGTYDGAVTYTSEAHRLDLHTLSGNHTIFYVAATTDTSSLHFQSDSAGGNFLMLAAAGSGSPAYSGGVGTVVYRDNGAATSWATRGDIATGFCDGNQHLITLTDLNVGAGWAPAYLGAYAGFGINPLSVTELISYPSNLSSGDYTGIEANIVAEYGL
jgi:hypothetical protein